jgi:hypothetical protein
MEPRNSTKSSPGLKSQSSKLCYDRQSVGQSVLVSSTHLGLTTRFYYCQTIAGLLMWGALSDERTGLPFTNAAGPRQRSHSWVRVGTRDHILLSQIRDSPNLEGQVPVFISPRNRVAQLYPPALGSLFVASYDSQGYGGSIRTRLHAEWRRKQKQKLAAGNQPARSLLASGPAGTHGHIFVQCQDLCFFFLSLILLIDKGRIGRFCIYRLVFTYYTLFHLRLLFPPPRVLVEYI